MRMPPDSRPCPGITVGSLTAALGLGSALALAIPVAGAQEGASSFEVEAVAEGLNQPWGMTFLPGDGRMLVTELPGGLVLVDRDNGGTTRIAGVPEVDARGQGGLLDVAVHPDFADEPWVYLTWSGIVEGEGTSTHLGRGLLDLEAGELTEFEVLFAAAPATSGAGHYGSRIAFDGDGRVYFTVGDRQSKDFGPQHYAQDTTNALGTTLRLEADGEVPQENPFVGDPDAEDAIFSYGHRNVQAMAFHPDTGALWQGEHGEYNGDEVNVIVAGGNYGWPIATWAVDYQTGERFAPVPPEVPETIDPVHFWTADDPQGFPPSGLAFYDGNAFPEWRGNMLMGNLAHQYLGRFTVDGENVTEAERLLEGEGWRIRDVAVGPDDGFVYVLIDGGNAPLVRLRP